MRADPGQLQGALRGEPERARRAGREVRRHTGDRPAAAVARAEATGCDDPRLPDIAGSRVSRSRPLRDGRIATERQTARIREAWAAGATQALKEKLLESPASATCLMLNRTAGHKRRARLSGVVAPAPSCEVDRLAGLGHSPRRRHILTRPRPTPPACRRWSSSWARCRSAYPSATIQENLKSQAQRAPPVSPPCIGGGRATNGESVTSSVALYRHGPPIWCGDPRQAVRSSSRRARGPVVPVRARACAFPVARRLSGDQKLFVGWQSIVTALNRAEGLGFASPAARSHFQDRLKATPSTGRPGRRGFRATPPTASSCSIPISASLRRGSSRRPVPWCCSAVCRDDRPRR